jgi:hypothetical protein
MNSQPKPVKRCTVKTKRRRAKRDNITDVRERVFLREHDRCRIATLLNAFGFYWTLPGMCELELAHLLARGMGGNPSLSRDTTENTFVATRGLHKGPRSLHSGHLKVRPLTSRGTDGPLCIEFYEQLPTEVQRD